MTLIRPRIALMDTDYFEQRIKTDDTDTTTDCTDGHGFFEQRIKTDDTDCTNLNFRRLQFR